jgi:hypothetical protein
LSVGPFRPASLRLMKTGGEAPGTKSALRRSRTAQVCSGTPTRGRADMPWNARGFLRAPSISPLRYPVLRTPATSLGPTHAAVPRSASASACVAPSFRLRRHHALCGPSRSAAALPACAGRCLRRRASCTCRSASLAPCRGAGSCACATPRRGMSQGHRDVPVRHATRGVLPRFFRHTPSLPTSSGCLPIRSSRVMPCCS